MPKKNIGAPSTLHRYKHTFITFFSASHRYTLLCNKLHIVLRVKKKLRTCITWTQVVNLGFMLEQHAPQAVSPTSVNTESGTQCMSLANGDDADPMGIENTQPGEAPPSVSLEDHILQHSTWRPGCSSPSSPKASSMWRSSSACAMITSQNT